MNELSLHILDICQNSIKANATMIKIIIIEDVKSNLYQIEIHDNGHGMNEKTLSEVSDPFFTTRTTRNVGLGVSLFKMAAEMAGGSLQIRSKVNQGTTVVARFEHNHIDRAPLGDMEDTISILLMNEADIEYYYEHRFNDETYIFDTTEIKQILDDIPITDYDVILWIKNNIKEGITTIHKEEAK